MNHYISNHILYQIIDYHQKIYDNPDSSKDSIWHQDWEGQWIKLYYKSYDTKRWDTCLFLLKLNILSDVIWSGLGLVSCILFEEIVINPNVREWRMEKGFYIVDIFTTCGLIYCSDSNDHYS